MIKIRTVIEIAGFPKEHIEQAMQKIMANLKQEKDLIISKASVADIRQLQTMWSIFSELELEFNSINPMLNFYFDYTPSYIEILEPQEMELKSIDFANFINDLLARLHQYNSIVANMNAENIVLKKKLQATPQVQQQAQKENSAQKKQTKPKK
ncbi:MAG: hypothetical protein AABW41_04700 [Nanoarchaeota archaeon]